MHESTQQVTVTVDDWKLRTIVLFIHSTIIDGVLKINKPIIGLHQLFV